MNFNDILKAESALSRAVNDGEINELRKLILEGLDVNILLDDGVTLLMQAAQARDLEVVKELVELGADVNIQQPGGTTALEISAYQGFEEIFDFLAPLTSPDLYQEAKAMLSEGKIRRERRENIILERLQTAVGYRDINSILEIVEDGFDLNTINEYGKTVLFTASLWGYYDIVQVLVDNGADVNVCAEGGSDTPLISAISGVGLLKYHTFLSDKTKHQHISVMKILLDAGANVNANTTEGWNALLSAINSQSIEAVRLLLDYGVTVNVNDIRGNTALNRAKERGNPEIIQLLIDAGAMKSNDGI